MQNTPYGVLPSASNQFGQPSQGYYPGAEVANLNPYQTQGLEALMGGANWAGSNANKLMGMGMAGADMYGNWMQQGGPQIDQQFMDWMSPGEINNIQGNFEVNPFIEGQADAYSSAGQRAFERNVLPTMNSNAIMSGNMGGSRHALAQGLATSDFNSQLQESLAGLYGSAWQNAAQNQLQSRGQTLTAMGQDRSRATEAALGNARNQISAYGQMPQMMSGLSNLAGQASNMAMLPGQTQLQAGNLYRTVAQQQLDAAKNRWDWTRDEPWNRLQDYASIVQGTSVPNRQYPEVQNSMDRMLQGAMGGANFGSQFGNWFGGGGGGGLPSMGGLGAGGSFTSPLSTGIW